MNKPVTLSVKDQQIIGNQIETVAACCSAISFGGSVPENTAKIMAALDVVAGVVATSPCVQSETPKVTMEEWRKSAEKLWPVV